MTTIFTVKRGSPLAALVALILTDQSTSASEMFYFENIKELQEGVREQYGQDAEFVSPSQFQRELQQRQVHSPAIIAMLERQSELFGVDATSYIIYGSPMRPMSTVWFRVTDTMCIPANKQSTGYHSYVAVPQPLSNDVIEKYELEFVSRPAK